MKKKKLFLLGSTGSIGVNALSCVHYLREQGQYNYEVVGLAAGQNVSLLREQINTVQPKVVYLAKEEALPELRSDFPRVRFFSGSSGMKEAMNATSYSICLNALVGSAGLMPSIWAAEKGVDLALANKESLIMAGHLLLKKMKKVRRRLLPVDSEHSAIFHLQRGWKKNQIERLILTASGGPFFFQNNTNPSVEEALAHPTWKMGPKISIDSATMMNKGLEVIEAHYLFDTPYEKIDCVVHPQSVVHSMIETRDKELYAQLGHSDMRHPIQNALTFPKIIDNPLKRFDITQAGELSFFPPDFERFPMLKLAYESGKRGGSSTVVMNAANEAAVQLFLKGNIAFKQIPEIVEKEVLKHSWEASPSIETIFSMDRETQIKIKQDYKKAS